MKKRVIWMLCMVFCLMPVLAGCSLTRQNPNLAEKKLVKESKKYVTDFWSEEQWTNSTTGQYAMVVEQYGSIKKLKEVAKAQNVPDEQLTPYIEAYEQYQDYKKAVKTYGGMKKIVSTSYSLAADSASVAVTVTTEKKGKLVFTMNYDKTGAMTDHKYEEYQSIGQIMGRAGLNTVMSMGIVFCVLIFIAVIISCFKFINQAQTKPAKEAEPEPAAPVVAETPVEEEDLTDDTELVAVIAAAIAAAEEMESPDGLVVRSIVRRR